MIKYRVFNKKNLTEQAELTFNIIFEKELGINSDQIALPGFSILQNRDNHISIHLAKTERFLGGQIIDINGKTVRKIQDISNELLLGDIPTGVLSKSKLPAIPTTKKSQSTDFSKFNSGFVQSCFLVFGNVIGPNLFRIELNSSKIDQLRACYFEIMQCHFQATLEL